MFKPEHEIKDLCRKVVYIDVVAVEGFSAATSSITEAWFKQIFPSDACRGFGSE
ncbi:hypothetical protein [Geotalea sp. SG265]|uniref:hypothetical protein n=1 Tax=Geotalea sp. SG265 TaxID=2922867 RepID=UPI001FB0408B|nr:hypothetical protein [Geotalea sp. SG265]